MEFYYPEMLLLGIPLSYLFWRYARADRPTNWVRGLIVLLLLMAVSGPLYNLGGTGTDVIVVADSSRSLSQTAKNNILELIRNLDQNRGRGDRVGLVTFGTTAQIERVPSETAQLSNFTKPVNPDGSDLNSAIQSAVDNLVDQNRPARILVLSDGEATGVDPAFAGRIAREAGVPIDYRAFERVKSGDLAIDTMNLPDSISPREPFQFSVSVHAERAADGQLIIRRNGEVITVADYSFRVGQNRLMFRDLVERPGFFHYEAELVVENDPIEENNRGESGLRVDAGPRVLVLNSDGEIGNLSSALSAGKISVETHSINSFPLSQDSLDPYRVVILENIPARHLGRLKMEQLAQYVEDLGGGLMVTGGQRSFGVGGYFNSPLDEILPVSMELREEHRKNRMALAVALDRSGSMAVPVSGGKKKMDLANLGTAECIRLLSPSDSVAVIAVDIHPHIIIPLTNIDAPEKLTRQVLGIQSMGGGIYVYEALVAAGKEVTKASQLTKHIVLFADASDSENPGGYVNLIKQYREAGITISVIGLGKPTDPDAKLLEEIAKLGGGNIMFTEDPQELPRLFSEDTMSVARSSFIEKDPQTQADGIPALMLPDARLIGDWGTTAFPAIDGYNLSYLKPEATMGVATQDEYQAPLSAFWYRGLGRVVALSMEVDGKYSGNFGSWEGYNDFLITHTRWLLGSGSPQDLFLKIQREGQDAVATVELDPDRPDRGGLELPQLVVVRPGEERSETLMPQFSWIGPDTLQARFRMDQMGTYRTLVQTGSREFERGPAISLPYSPEFAPRQGLPSGKEVLADLAKVTGGQELTNILEVFRNAPRSPKKVSVVPYLLAVALLLLILEIAGRRLSLWELLHQSGRQTQPDLAQPAHPASSSLWSWLPQRPARRKKSVSGPVTGDKTQVVTPANPAPSPVKKPTSPSEKETEKPKVDVFAQAKNRAKRRTD